MLADARGRAVRDASIRSVSSVVCTGWSSRAALPTWRATSRRSVVTATPTAAWPPLRGLLASHPPEVLDALTRPPQTNEVGAVDRARRRVPDRRCRDGAPARGCSRSVRAPGSTSASTTTGTSRTARASARPTRRCASSTSGRAASRRSTRRSQVVERGGCDRDPIDPTTDDGPAHAALVPVARSGRALRDARGAPSTSPRRVPARVSSGPTCSSGSTRSSRRPRPGVATVVFHSIVWQYLGEEGRDEELRRLAAAGAAGDDRRCRLALAAARAAARPACRTPSCA